MFSQTTLFILGPDDPEMKAIASLLQRTGMRFIYANHGNKRALPDTAYKANPPTIPPDIQQVVLVECKPRRLSRSIKIIVIDHHKSGDPGYDEPPARYWQGSSLGQVYALLEAHVPDKLKGITRKEKRALEVIAASDHCLAAAREGKCPGVTPQAVAQQQLHSIAEGTRRSEQEVRTAMKKAGKLIDSAPEIEIGRHKVKDVGYVEPGYSLAYLTIREKAAQESVPCLVRQRSSDGEKVMLWAPASILKHFPAWARIQGAYEIFGVPNRGYAGAILPN